jgi:hypothetical protein
MEMIWEQVLPVVIVSSVEKRIEVTSILYICV